MSQLDELYQSVILDHHKAPRNYRAMPEASCHAEGYNPLCGDRVEVWLRFDDEDRIADVSFQGQGCAISRASASMMTAALKGLTRADAERLFERFHAVVTTGDGADDAVLGKLGVLAGVAKYPMRVKCATLAWHAVRRAMRGEG